MANTPYRHRNRSHPTLAPLTTIPTSPSTSYIYPSTSIPTTPSLLSRPSSSTRLRQAHDFPTPVPSTSKSSSALNKKPHRRRKTNTNQDDEDWLTRTASTLTLTRLEEKGQSWLVARNSSTSLTGGDVDDEDDEFPEGEFSTPRSRRSRVQSQMGSANRLNRLSRRDSGVKAAHGEGAGREREEELDIVGPDFVDVDEEDEVEMDGEEEEDVDDGEMRKVVMGRVGGWVDWAVGWMDMRTEGDEADDDDELEGENGAQVKGKLDPVELQKRLRRKKKQDAEAESGTSDTLFTSAPPDGEKAGVWSDAKWLLSVATKAAL